jgi:hypothetical protein
MDKEIQMVVKGTAALIACALVLVACQGQNVFKRESDPTRAYNLQDTVPYNAEKAHQDQIRRAEQLKKPCGIPFTLSVYEKDAKGNRLEEQGQSAVFREGQEKTIFIEATKIDGMLDSDQAWDVKPVAGPCPLDKCFQLAGKSDKTATYKFTWKAAQNAADAGDRAVLTLQYIWPVRVNCSSVPVTDKISLFVKKGSDQGPVITFPGLQSEAKFGDNFKFAVQIDDASAKAKFVATPDEAGTVDGKPAVDCTATGRVVETAGSQKASVFDCTFDTRALPNEQIKDLIGSGKSMTAVFSIKAANATANTTATGRVNVKFERVDFPKAQTAVPGAAPKSQGAKS